MATSRAAHVSLKARSPPPQCHKMERRVKELRSIRNQTGAPLGKEKNTTSKGSVPSPRTLTHSLEFPCADSTRPMTSRINLPSREPRVLASHTQSPTRSTPTLPSKRVLSSNKPLHSHTKCSLEKSSPHSGQRAHSDGSQGTLKVPRWQWPVRNRAA